MLCTLSIKDMAIIQECTIEFEPGLNILTGETGAGKSIIVDSMSLVLGGRADKEMVRTGAPKAWVEASFDITEQSDVAELLKQMDYEEEDGTLILTREVMTTGRTVCRINGRLATLTQLKTISQLLVDIHGQHDHQAILDPSNHGKMLDAFIENAIIEQKSNVIRLSEEYHAIQNRLEKMLGNEAQRQRSLDLLEYQIREIDGAKLIDGEEEELLSRRILLNNSGKISEALTESRFLLSNDDGMNVSSISSLSNATGHMEDIADYSEEFSQLYERMNTLLIELEDISESIRDASMQYDFDPAEIDAVEDRLAAIRNLSRKYGSSIREILAFRDEAQCQYDELENHSVLSHDLSVQLQKIYDQWLGAAMTLSEIRQRKAAQLSDSITKELRELGMSKTVMSIDVSRDSKAQVSPNGLDDIRFLISTNPGEPLKSLEKIASGGETSRIMLAIKNTLAESDAIGTMIFDEIDTGISGKIAQVVAEKMCRIARYRQVICVTHSASIAAMADTHFVIHKEYQKDSTITTTVKLQSGQRYLEISRLVGGEAISSVSAEHAKQMLLWAEGYKNKLA